MQRIRFIFWVGHNITSFKQSSFFISANIGSISLNLLIMLKVEDQRVVFLTFLVPGRIDFGEAVYDIFVFSFAASLFFPLQLRALEIYEL
jgi:hypothetical protein